ncbi:hypothetical protein SpCBS45565_g07621 [Spizellomyces sp. 'palustris']|nr:hypothetical protein SpCBS45565_g07621 [Spizellomyces sp. 'palustris']
MATALGQMMCQHGRQLQPSGSWPTKREMAAKPTDNVDDLDSYLDDVLDDFTAPPPIVQPAVSSASGASSASADTGFDDDFARQLASNMEHLFKESFGEEGESANPEINNAMSKLLDTFKELQVASEPAQSSQQQQPSLSRDAPNSERTPAPKPTQQKSFQETIAQTMHKLRDSSDKVEQQVAEDAKLASLTGGMSEEAMEQMMKELEGMMSSGDFDGMFGGLMDQLMSKELLYEPMKDLATKYPQWLAANESKLSLEELEKYRRQHEYIVEIVHIYDASTTAETSEEDGKRVADLMQKMQECGNPPDEILQELAPGLEIGADGMPKLPGGPGGQECNIM